MFLEFTALLSEAADGVPQNRLPHLARDILLLRATLASGQRVPGQARSPSRAARVRGSSARSGRKPTPDAASEATPGDSPSLGERSPGAGGDAGPVTSPLPEGDGARE